MKETKVKVLYLEDKISNVQAIENVLRNVVTDIESKVAKTEKEFLKFVLRFKPDVIVSALRLDKYSAFQALQLLTDEDHLVPVIVLAEEIDLADASELMKFGASCLRRSNYDLLPVTFLNAVEKGRTREEMNRIEVKLKRGQERLIKIFDNAPEAIINIGFKGEILEINPTGLNILQTDELKLKNKNIFNFIHADDLKKFRKFHNSVGIGNKRTEKFRIVGTRNEERWVESSAVPLLNEEDHVVSILTINRDITDLVNVSDKFEVSEEKFRKLTMHAPVGIFLTDDKGDSIYVNERWCELAGIRGKDAMGNGWIKALHPDDRENVFKEWYNCAAEGREFKMDYRFLKPNGEITWLSSRAVALNNIAGEKTGYIGTITDITTNKMIEHSLFESEQILHAVEEIGNIGYWEREIETNRPVWSKQMFNIYETDAGKGVPDFVQIVNIIHPDDREKVIEFNKFIKEVGEKIRVEYRLLFGTRVKHLIAIAQRVNNPFVMSGTKIVGVAIDVTDQKKNELENVKRGNEVWYENIVLQVPVAIFQQDENGKINFVNEQFLKLFELNKEDAMKGEWLNKLKYSIEDERSSFAKLIIGDKIKFILINSKSIGNEKIRGRIISITDLTDDLPQLQGSI